MVFIGKRNDAGRGGGYCGKVPGCTAILLLNRIPEFFLVLCVMLMLDRVNRFDSSVDSNEVNYNLKGECP